MFELARLAGHQEEGIALATRKNTPIKNAQAPAVPDYQSLQADDRRNRTNGNWVIRKGPTGIYNCYGHVFASRRTAIYEQSELERIFHEDDYRELGSQEAPRLGDLAVYYLAGATSISHVGFVAELKQLAVGIGFAVVEPAVWILSKWNDSASEVLHHVNDAPWPDFEVRYWTDRGIMHA